MRGASVPLASWFDAVGITSDANRSRGDFDGFGRSFPAEGLVVVHAGDPEPWVAREYGVVDHVVCREQLIVLPTAATVDYCVLIGAADGGSFEERFDLLDSEGKAYPFIVGLTDWLAARSAFDETCYAEAYHLHEPHRDIVGPRPKLWASSARLDTCVESSAIRLPWNPCLHVFAMMLGRRR
jgi:hypothetical protein